MGREYMGMMRHTFLIDAEGKIERIYLKVKAATMADTILRIWASADPIDQIHDTFHHEVRIQLEIDALVFQFPASRGPSPPLIQRQAPVRLRACSRPTMDCKAPRNIACPVFCGK